MVLAIFGGLAASIGSTIIGTALGKLVSFFLFTEYSKAGHFYLFVSTHMSVYAIGKLPSWIVQKVRGDSDPELSKQICLISLGLSFTIMHGVSGIIAFLWKDPGGKMLFMMRVVSLAGFTLLFLYKLPTKSTYYYFNASRVFFVFFTFLTFLAILEITIQLSQRAELLTRIKVLCISLFSVGIAIITGGSYVVFTKNPTTSTKGGLASLICFSIITMIMVCIPKIFHNNEGAGIFQATMMMALTILFYVNGFIPNNEIHPFVVWFFYLTEMFILFITLFVVTIYDPEQEEDDEIQNHIHIEEEKEEKVEAEILEEKDVGIGEEEEKKEDRKDTRTKNISWVFHLFFLCASLGIFSLLVDWKRVVIEEADGNGNKNIKVGEEAKTGCLYGAASCQTGFYFLKLILGALLGH
eukprot:GHVP01059442.1.p1 GENE.GHVP01059442.1~~GHVP01059442.1.p1  ORF type:complete len:410 (+),score=65.73 GHVP01059442.1:290-1519(+)